MSATWFRAYLAPIAFYVGPLLDYVQKRDDRVHFRNGFVASQVLDINNNNVLTIDSEIGIAQYEPSGGTVPRRNGSGYLKNAGYLATVGGYGYSTPVEIERVAPTPLHEQVGWTLNASQNPISDGTGGDAYWRTEIVPPDGSTLTKLRARVSPQVLARADVPGIMPRLILWSISEDGTVTEEGYQDDESASVVAYEQPHDIELTVTVNVDRATTRYIAGLRPEDGDNAASGLVLLRPCVWTASVATLEP